jgi:hypothetical protein
MTDDKQITAWRVFDNDHRTRIHPAPKERDWMNKTTDEYAYRCLPLNIANQHGWCIYLNESFSCYWDGSNSKDGVKILDSGPNVGASFFGSGIVTFHVMHIFTTPPEYNLYITGAPNFFKKDINPLTGIYESDWAPYSFTMNWKIMEPHKVITFSPLEPICFFFPIPRNLIEDFTIDAKNLSENKILHDQHFQFSRSRDEHQKGLEDGTLPYGDWQKHYFQGKYPDGSKCPVNHQTRLKIDGKPDHLLPKNMGI